MEGLKGIFMGLEGIKVLVVPYIGVYRIEVPTLRPYFDSIVARCHLKVFNCIFWDFGLLAIIKSLLPRS